MAYQIFLEIAGQENIYYRVESKILVPVLRYDEIGENGDYTKPLSFDWEIWDAFAVLSGNDYRQYKTTKEDREFLKSIFKIVSTGGKVITTKCPKVETLVTFFPKRKG